MCASSQNNVLRVDVWETGRYSASLDMGRRIAIFCPYSTCVITYNNICFEERRKRFVISYYNLICLLLWQYRVESMMMRTAKPQNYVAMSPSVQQRSRFVQLSWWNKLSTPKLKKILRKIYLSKKHFQFCLVEKIKLLFSTDMKKPFTLIHFSCAVISILFPKLPWILTTQR